MATYVPAGRWVRVRSTADGIDELQGRWHLATEDPRFSFRLPAEQALLACGRNLATSSKQGTTLVLADDQPRNHVCSICARRYTRDQLFGIRVHNLTTASPA